MVCPRALYSRIASCSFPAYVFRPRYLETCVPGLLVVRPSSGIQTKAPRAVMVRIALRDPAWELSPGFRSGFRLGYFAWAVTLGIYCLATLAWKLWFWTAHLTVFPQDLRLGTSTPGSQAWGIQWKSGWGNQLARVGATCGWEPFPWSLRHRVQIFLGNLVRGCLLRCPHVASLFHSITPPPRPLRPF